jgi:Trk K+ transport system NAD-binding subunit
MGRKKILFIGMNYFMRLLAAELNRPCIAIDNRSEVFQEIPHVDGLAFIAGDAASVVLWKRLPAEELSHVIFSLKDDDTAEEVCRIVRNIIKLDIPIIAIDNTDKPRLFCDSYGVTRIKPLSAALSSVTGIVEKNYTIPKNIGLGKGEVAEVTIARHSHLVDRKLKYLKSSLWHLAAIFREGKLVLPDPDAEIHIGDKVLLTGQPSILRKVVDILVQGSPQFPLQYGETLRIWEKGDSISAIAEARYFMEYTHANKIALVSKACEAKADLDIIPETTVEALFDGAGAVIVPNTLSMGFRLTVKKLFKHISAPLLISKGGFPYTKLVALLNAAYPGRVLQIGFELFRASGIPFEAVYTALPETLRNAKLKEEYLERQNLVRDYESIDHIKLNFKVLEGNPVKAFSDYIKDDPDALVITDCLPGGIGFLEPHIPYLLVRRIPNSILLIPAVS